MTKVIALELLHKIIDKGLGKIFHEIMYLLDDTHLTFEFDNHDIIVLTIKFTNSKVDYSKNLLNEIELIKVLNIIRNDYLKKNF